MATILEASITQSTRETRRWTADFTDDIPTGGSVTAGTAFHVPPSGATAAVTVTNTTTTVTAGLGPLTVTGVHYLDIQATYSNTETSIVRVTFAVNYPAIAARASMADLIVNLRSLTNAGANEYTVAGLPYWSDAQIQTVLDRHVSYINHEEIYPRETYETGGSVNYYDYQSPHRFYESVLAGTPTTRFVIQDETGAAVGSAGFTVDYPRGLVTFGTATGGLSRYVTGYSYDMNAAAADVWMQKAAHYSVAYDVNTDNHGLKRSQIIQNCMMLSKEFAAGAMIYSVSMERSDTEA